MISKGAIMSYCEGGAGDDSSWGLVCATNIAIKGLYARVPVNDRNVLHA